MPEPAAKLPAAPAWLGDLDRELDGLKADGLYRLTRSLQSPVGPEVVLDGQRLILAASNDYLGLAGHPALARAAAEAAQSRGAGAGAARLVSGGFDLAERLETELAAFKGVDRALVFSTGYMANLGVISSLVGPGDAVFSDQLNHASIVDGCRLSRAERYVYDHNKVGHLAELLARTRGRYRRRLIITDGVFSMDGDLAPLPELAALSRDEEAILAVDDAHATGVIGEHGGGSLDYYNLSPGLVIQIGTMSKALGALGGYVAGPAVIIDYLRNRARSFFYTTGLPPAVLGAARQGLELVINEPERRQGLKQRAGKLRQDLADRGWLVPPGETPIIPIIVGSAHRAVELSARLLEQGILIPAIRPPTVAPGTARLRLALSAAHTGEHLSRIMGALDKCR